MLQLFLTLTPEKLPGAVIEDDGGGGPDQVDDTFVHSKL